MREITEAEKRVIWDEVKKEFPDDEMIQEIHYVRRIHRLQTSKSSGSPSTRRRKKAFR